MLSLVYSLATEEAGMLLKMQVAPPNTLAFPTGRAVHFREQLYVQCWLVGRNKPRQMPSRLVLAPPSPPPSPSSPPSIQILFCF